MEDVMDMLYDGVGDQVQEMVEKNQAEQAIKDAEQAKRDAEKAEEARLEEARQMALAAADRELIARPLEECEHGPGSNGPVKKVKKEAKQDKKRKEREEMTQEQRDEEDAEKARRVEKGKETKRRNLATKAAQKEREANQKPPLPDLHEIDRDIAQANSEYSALEHYPDVEAKRQEIATRIGHFEEMRADKLKELELNSVAAGSGSTESVVASGRWVPEKFFLPADLKYASDGTDVMHPDALPGLRDAVRLGQQQIRDLKMKGEGDSPKVAWIEESVKAYRGELQRRLHATKQWKADEAKRQKANALNKQRERAINDPFKAEDYLSAADLAGWWQTAGKFLARQKLNPNTTAVPGTIWTPDEPLEVIPAQVETEEM